MRVSLQARGVSSADISRAGARTPAATLTRAREIALRAGLRYVYTGNVHDRDGGTTHCPGCAAPLIVRDWHEILRYRVTDEGACPDCGTAIAGRFEVHRRDFGRRRIPVRLAEMR